MALQHVKEIKWKGLSHYLSKRMKQGFNRKPLCTIWSKKYAPKKVIGACVDLVKESKTKTAEDFFYWYVDNGYKTFGDKTIDPRQRGRTLEEIEEIGYKYWLDCHDKQRAEDNYTLEDFIDCVIMHAIVETAGGALKENEVEAKLSFHGYECEHGNHVEDSELDIDFKVSMDGELRYLIQVKPISFFFSSNVSTVGDRINAFDKHRKGKEIFPGVPYYYMIYDKNGEWCCKKKDKSYLFTYEDLVHDDGTGKPKITQWMFEKYVVDKYATLFNKN